MYIGNWLNGIKEGHGQLLHSNGNVYTGEYENDARNGYGVFTWTSGAEYRGPFVNDAKHGTGIYRYPNGDMHKVTYENDISVSSVPLTEQESFDNAIWFAFDDYYEARNVVEDIFLMNSSYDYKTHFRATNLSGGGVYYGQLRDGQAHGFGMKERDDGVLYNGLFNSGRLVIGRYIFASGGIYVGQFNENGRQEGYGQYILIFNNGGERYYAGKFTDGRLTSGLFIEYDPGHAHRVRVWVGEFATDSAGFTRLNGYGVEYLYYANFTHSGVWLHEDSVSTLIKYIPLHEDDWDELDGILNDFNY
jgi:hypothetical protein